MAVLNIRWIVSTCNLVYFKKCYSNCDISQYKNFTVFLVSLGKYKILLSKKKKIVTIPKHLNGIVNIYYIISIYIFIGDKLFSGFLSNFHCIYFFLI